MDLSNKHLVPGVIGQLLGRGVQVLRLSRTSVTAPLLKNRYGGYSYPASRPSRLKFLDLSMAVIDSESLQKLLGTCHLLIKLALETCEVNERILMNISQNKKLDTLHMGSCWGITKRGMDAILTQCNKLREVNIGWLDADEDTMNLISEKIPTTVEKLNISGYRQTLTNEHVGRILDRCTNLRELDISDSSQVSSEVCIFISISTVFINNGCVHSGYTNVDRKSWINFRTFVNVSLLRDQRNLVLGPVRLGEV